MNHIPSDSSQHTDTPPRSVEQIRIVGIGASAGGLEGLKQFFQQASPETGLAFVIVQHLSPDHKSMMCEILSSYTRMQIYPAADGMEVEPDTIYLAPPRKSLSIRKNRLCLADPHPDEVHHPIDYFFHSLAMNLGKQAIGVVLSGTGSDGTRGITAIKRSGGIVFAQNEETARFEGMPRSAIESGHVDYVLSPEKIASKLRFPSSLVSSSSHALHAAASIDSEALMAKILEKVRERTNIDFSFYKRNSLLRRIEKRMSEARVSSLAEYEALLERKEEEILALRQDLLIHVTHFFRDPEAFEILRDKVLPRLIRAKLQDKSSELRIWTAGCSTGEEAYSIGMLALETLEQEGAQGLFSIRIFATDVDKQSVDYANHGVYPLSIESSVSKERLAKHFVRHGDTYQVSRELRRLIIFAPHNLTKDPPFSGLDLISCRNMLIYLQQEVQQKVLSMFGFALSPKGYLFLGPSETVGKQDHLFEPVSGKWNIFRHTNRDKDGRAESSLLRDGASHSSGSSERKANRRSPLGADSQDNRRQNQFYSIYVHEHMPASLLVDEKLDVQHLTGNVQPFLAPMEGAPSWNLQKMLEPGLAVAVMTAVQQIRSGLDEVVFRHLAVKTRSGEQRLNVTVRLFSKTGAAYAGSMLVILEQVPEEESMPASSIDLDDGMRRQMAWLEQQQRSTEAKLHSAIEELEAANEELQSTNEELQALNEELVTVNSEYQFKIQELTELNNDMDLFLVSTKIGTIFLDTQFCIRRFTPAVTKEIHLMNVDIGRPFHHISHQFYYDRFLEDAAQVLQSLRSLEKEIKSRSGRWYKMRMMPYRTLEHLTKGVIITLVDITELKEANEELLRLSHAIEQSPILVVISDLEGGILYANRPFHELTGETAESIYGRSLETLDNWEASGISYADVWSRLKRGEIWEGELAGIGKDGAVYWEQARLMPIVMRGEMIHYMKIAENITDRKTTEEMLRKSEMLGAVGQLAAGIAHEIRNPLTSLKGFTKLMQEDNRRNYISIMAMELERIEQIVSELLVLSKPQAIDFHPVVLGAVLRDVVMLIEAQAIMNNVQLELEMPDTELLVQGVDNQLKQVFINLIKNSIEAMGSGGIIQVKAAVGEDGMVWTQVIDQGSGIPPEKLAKLGEPFFSTKAKGTGLGLVMTYKIIENHHGRMYYESELGKGTTGYVGLPLARERQEERER